MTVARRFQVLTINNISQVGLARLDGARFEVGPAVSNPDAILVRSADLHSLAMPGSLKAVGRAGSGTSNIPVPALTARGIPVFNAPGANANAVKELVIASLIIASRSLGPAWQFARGLEGDNAALHKAVEAGKKAFAGFELTGRTLAVIGLGAIGGRVANAGVALGMRVIGFDPVLSIEAAWQLSPQVQQAASLDAAFRLADFVSLHVPLGNATRGLINAERLKTMKDRVSVVNFAREGVVDAPALVAGLDGGKVHFYVSDFPTAVTRNHPRCVTFPHLGASTVEAEDNCAVMVADQVRDFLDHGAVRNAVNFPQVTAPRQTAHRLVCAGRASANIPASVAALFDTVMNTVSATRGDLTYLVIDTDTPISEDLRRQAAAVTGVTMARVIQG